jgi:hypothetical protein
MPPEEEIWRLPRIRAAMEPSGSRTATAALVRERIITPSMTA